MFSSLYLISPRIYTSAEREGGIRAVLENHVNDKYEED